MNHRILRRFRLSLILCLWFGGLCPAVSAEDKVIAIVRDGDSEFFDHIIQNFTKELDRLAEGKYTYRLKDQFNAEYQDGQALKQLRKALADDEVDLIYTAGIVASHRAAQLAAGERSKPVVAGAVEFSNLAHRITTDSGTSKLPNYTFIMAPSRIQSDLEAFKKLAGTTHIFAVVDQQVVKVLGTDVENDLAKIHQQLGITLTIVPAARTARETLRNIPRGATAVYTTLLPSMPTPERVRLIKGLTQRGVMTFSMVGVSDVKAGAFAGMSAGSGQAFFRRSAINIHQLLSGIGTDLLPVVLNGYDQLTINLATGKQLGWSPDYDTVLSANFLNKNMYRKSAGSLNLQTAMKKASQLNPDVLAARAAQQAAAWQARSLQSRFRPQLSLNGGLSSSGVHDRMNTLTTSPRTRTLSLGVEITQVLYSDQLCSEIRAQLHAAEAAKYDLESARLDVIQSVANSYLDVLNTEALWRIEKENLILTENNLQLAKLRRDIGVAEASEVYRWQANVAQAKSILLQRDAARKSARVQLNVDLAVKRTSHWELTDIALGDHQFYLMDHVTRPVIRNLEGLGTFTSFVQSLAKYRSPEIKSFDRTLRSQGILLDERARRNKRPVVSLSAGLSQIVYDSQLTNRDTQTEWTVGLGFTFPLWEGGLKKTELSRIDAVIRQLQAQRRKAMFLIEQRALNAAYAISASHPGMRLSRQAREFSEKNYEAVKSKYSQGAVSIVELLDAQNQLLQLKQSEASATYQYTKDIIAVQRAMGWYEYEQSVQQKQQWTQWLRNYFRTGSIHVTPIGK